MGMSFEFDEDGGEFSINYHKVLHQETFLPITRLLAADLIKSQYMSIGDFIKSLKDNSLEELNEISEDENHPNFEEMILITEMLAAAEGTNLGGTPEVHQRLNMFMTWLIFESLKRKGLVKIHYENLSFGDDMADKIVVEKIDFN
jgi:hypothetical protein